MYKFQRLVHFSTFVAIMFTLSCLFNSLFVFVTLNLNRGVCSSWIVFNCSNFWPSNFLNAFSWIESGIPNGEVWQLKITVDNVKSSMQHLIWNNKTEKIVQKGCAGWRVLDKLGKIGLVWQDLTGFDKIWMDLTKF